MARIPGRISERDLTCPTLAILASKPNGYCSTSRLIADLTDHFEPKGEDAEILDNRHDTKFSQIVRNMKSHKTASTNIIHRGLVEETARGFRITDSGREYLKKRCP
jgi:hypothetical protein